MELLAFTDMWTYDKPTEDGYYWYLEPGSLPVIVEYDRQLDWVMGCGSDVPSGQTTVIRSSVRSGTRNFLHLLYPIMKHSVEHLLPCPYRHLNKDLHLSRLSADVSYADKEFLHRIFPARGLFNRMTQIFFNSLVNELKANGITTYSPENADELARIIARRCTPAATPGQTTPRTVS